jgi:uncharacterized protein YggL (DUF469 family)
VSTRLGGFVFGPFGCVKGSIPIDAGLPNWRIVHIFCGAVCMTVCVSVSETNRKFVMIHDRTMILSQRIKSIDASLPNWRIVQIFCGVVCMTVCVPVSETNRKCIQGMLNDQMWFFLHIKIWFDYYLSVPICIRPFSYYSSIFDTIQKYPIWFYLNKYPKYFYYIFFN